MDGIDGPDGSSAPHAEREAARAAANRAELVARIAQAMPADGTSQPLPGLYLNRISTPMQPVHAVLEPSLTVIAQGSKELLQGASCYRYDPFHYLLGTVALPSAHRVLDVTPERPYLSLRLDLLPALVSAVLVKTEHGAAAHPADVRGIAVSPVDSRLLDATVRLVRLLDAPAEAPVLLPLIQQEIVYRLLVGEHGARLRHLAILGGYPPEIAQAVGYLRQAYDQPLRVAQLAHAVGMSVSGFHHHFKAVTALSPGQFQKQLRLQEARRLMLGENLDAASAAARVGYSDASHFNREYKSHFGIPPMRDVQRLREAALESAGLAWAVSR